MLGFFFANEFRTLVLSRLFYVGVAVSTVSFSSLRADDEETLEIIRAGYTQTITSMQSIWCRYEKRHDPPFPGNYPEKRIYEWAKERDRWHYSSPVTPSPDGEYARYWKSENEGILWKIDDRQTQVRKKRNTEGVEWITNFNPGRILGLYFNVGTIHVQEIDLQSLLETRPLTLVGRKKVNGHSCWQVDFMYPGITAEHDFPMSIWFDSEAGYLPRKFRSSITTNDEWIETVTEFLQVSPPDSSQVFFFPKGVVYSYDKRSQHMTVHDVKINADLPDTMFKPEIPAGYSVLDQDNKAQVEALLKKRKDQRRAEAKAGRADRDAEQAARKAAAVGKVPEFDARPKRTNRTALVLFLGGLAILISVTIFWFKGARAA